VQLPPARKSDHLEPVCSRGARVAAMFIDSRNVRQDKRLVAAPRWQNRVLILLRASKSCINSDRFKINPAANV